MIIEKTILNLSIIFAGLWVFLFILQYTALICQYNRKNQRVPYKKTGVALEWRDSFLRMRDMDFNEQQRRISKIIELKSKNEAKYYSIIIPKNPSINTIKRKKITEISWAVKSEQF